MQGNLLPGAEESHTQKQDNVSKVRISADSDEEGDNEPKAS